MRISGITVPENKQLWVGLTIFYGIGFSTAKRILREANVDPAKKPTDITSDDEARIRKELGERHFNLLETLGEFVIGLLLDEFRAPWVKVSIAKVGIARGVKRVGVQIERARQEKQ